MKKIALLFILISSYAFSQTVNDYKYVIGSVSLKNLIANRDLLLNKDVFIAQTGKLTYSQQDIAAIAEEGVLVN